MPVRYYAMLDDPLDPNAKLKKELHEGADSLLMFFMENRNAIKGELLFTSLSETDLSDIKLSYDTHTGEVILNSKKQGPVTSVFDKEAFSAHVSPVEEAISMLAQYDLLSRIYSLKHADIDEIRQIIEANLQLDANGNVTRDNPHSKVSNVIMQIQSFIKPLEHRFSRLFQTPHPPETHLAIHHALSDINKIKSTHQVLEIIKTIESKIMPVPMPDKKIK